MLHKKYGKRPLKMDANGQSILELRGKRREDRVASNEQQMIRDQ
jgi:hypothetical protein